MKRLKKFKLFEATEEMIQDIYVDVEDRVQYLQDEFDHIEFELEISRIVRRGAVMICLWIKSVKKDSNGHLETFKVNDILPLLKNLNEFMEMNGMSIYHLISDTPNKFSKSVMKLEFPHEDVTRIYIVWD
jgi:hypothetical protein